MRLETIKMSDWVVSHVDGVPKIGKRLSISDEYQEGHHIAFSGPKGRFFLNQRIFDDKLAFLITKETHPEYFL